MSKQGCLYIVATPIGNLGDITSRAIETLKSVDLIAAEDTRHSRHLLEQYNIKTSTFSLHQYNEKNRLDFILSRLEQGQSIALISDAGTPLISDPGFALVNTVIEAGFKVIPIPGASAVITALCASGLPTDRFVFEGFLPAKGALRKKRLQALQHETRTLIFYESVHRILNFVDLLIEVFGQERKAVMARELTKTFETIHADKLGELKSWMEKDNNQQKGEFVILVKGLEDQDLDNNLKEAEYRRILTILLADLPLKQAVKLAEEITGGAHRILYQMALSITQRVL